MSWARLTARARKLPGIEEGTCYGTPALYVRRRFLLRLKEDGDSVALKVDPSDRDFLLQADPSAFYLTPHYAPYPMVLVRLSRVRAGQVEELLERAWRTCAPKRLLAGYDGAPRRTRP